MVVAGGDRKGGAAGAQADVGQGVRHLVGAVASVVRVAKPELAVAVVAPTLDAAVVQDGAGVVVAGGDRKGDGPAHREGGEQGEPEL